jgi:hypothetical protein
MCAKENTTVDGLSNTSSPGFIKLTTHFLAGGF